MENENLGIGVLTLPLSSASRTPLSNLLEVLHGLSNSVYVITGNEGYNFVKNDGRFWVYGVNYKTEKNVLLKVLRYLSGQIKLSIQLVWIARNTRVWFFFGGEKSLIPMLILKLLRKKTVLAIAGSSIKDAKFTNDPCLIPIQILSFVNCSLSDFIILHSRNLISGWDFEKYRHKILIAHRHFLDFNTFTVTTPLAARPPLIGYIGRLSREKGIQDFTQALAGILSDQQDLRVLIGGDGPLREATVTSLQEAGVTTRVNLLGWVSHDDLPTYLNQLRLLVLPSYTEGLPNIVLEAMACGTPVLATPVGAIPDVIIDGKTGFIMENNSPECIAENVIRALDSPNRGQIAENGRRFVEENFTFEKVVDNWKRILQDIL